MTFFKMKPILLATLISISLILAPGQTQPAYAQTDITCEFDYIVQAGDWLSKIAEKYYGDILAYPAIAVAGNNKALADNTYATIDDYDLIEPGWRLCIPDAETASALLETIWAQATPASSVEPSPAAITNTTTLSQTEQPESAEAAAARKIFNALVQGDQNVQNAIQWETLYFLGQDLGKVYQTLTVAEQAYNRQVFITTFADVLQSAKLNDDILSNYRLQNTNTDPTQSSVLADLPDGQTIQFILVTEDNQLKLRLFDYFR